ncbi:MAG: outer membrane beta-barrel protein [Cytophaga sp.]|uniref:outer membrane beta-barrel protein n=1 Tax=Cytophaga sp. TaxID=29535 RepID=UPI003F7D96F5
MSAIVTSCFVFLFAFNSMAQQEPAAHKVTDTLVTIDLTNHSLKECLIRLSAAYQINFSYINDDLPLHKQMHIAAGPQSLSVVLDSICKQADLKYLIIGTQIVLKKNEMIVTTPVQDSTAAAPADTLPAAIIVDTIYLSDHKSSSGEYVRDKKYSKYFYRVFGKKRTPDSMIVVSSNGRRDTIDVRETRQKYHYINRIYTKNKFSVGVFGGGGVSYRTLSSQDIFVTERNADESSIASYTFGANVTYYMPSQRLSFRSGISYMTFGEKGSFIEIIYSPPPGGPQPEEIEHKYINHYNYIMLPFMAGYSFPVSNKFGLSVHSGFAVAFLVSKKSTYVEPFMYFHSPDNLSKNPHVHTYSSTGLVLPVHAELSYSVGENLQLCAAPTFNYFLTSIYSKSDLSKQKPYAFHLTVGISYMFKRNK